MSITVLIVDDSKLARIVTGRAMAALQPDWERVEAANADEALRIVGERPIDVALVDFNMPGRDGLALAGELRGRDPDMSIAVITANVQDEIVAQARALGAAFVAKPLSEDGLRPFVSEAALRLRARDGAKG